MTYTKTQWVDNTTPLSAANLNNLETQYDDAIATGDTRYARVDGGEEYLRTDVNAPAQTVANPVTFEGGVSTRLSDNAHVAGDLLNVYPTGLSTFWLSNLNGSEGWPVTTGFGFVVTHNIVGTAGYQEVVEMCKRQTPDTLTTKMNGRHNRKSPSGFRQGGFVMS